MNGGDPNLGGAQGNPSIIPPQPSGQSPEPIVAAPTQGSSSAAPVSYLNSAPVAPQPLAPPQPSPTIAPNPIASSNNTSYVEPQLSSQIPSSQSLPIQNSFYQRGFVMAPQDSDDIVLASSAGTKNSFRKKLIGIIAGVLGVIALAALIVWIVGMQSEAASNQSIQDTKTLFNIYANYLLYGTESEEPIGDNLSVWTTNTIEQQLSNTDEASRTLYFNNLLAKFNAFSESFSVNGNLTNDFSEEQLQRASNAVSSNIVALNDLVLYATTPNISTQSMIDMYLTDGSTAMLATVSDVYTPLIESDYIDSSIYGQIKIDLANSIVALYDTYSSLGCISGTVVSSECIANNFSDDISSMQNTVSAYTQDEATIGQNVKNYVVSLSTSIYLTIIGDIQYEE